MQEAMKLTELLALIAPREAFLWLERQVLMLVLRAPQDRLRDPLDLSTASHVRLELMKSTGPLVLIVPQVPLE